MSSIFEISGLIPGSLPDAIRDSMYSRSLRSKIMVVRLDSSLFRESGTFGLSLCIPAILIGIGYMPYVFSKHIENKQKLAYNSKNS